MQHGIVYRSTGSWYEVKVESGELLACRLRGKFKIKGLKVTNPVAVGDVVGIIPEGEAGKGVIVEIMPRTNYIIRKSTRKAYHGHIISSNIDQAVLIVTLAFPRTSQGFIDRFLVTCETFRIPAIIVFNKQDLVDEELSKLQEDWFVMYESLGYKCLFTSAEKEKGILSLKEALASKRSLLSGHSGVGKSSLINRLIPDVNQTVKEVSTFANKGVHTTTFAEMFDMDLQTQIIDTPGIKELGLFEVGDEELAHYFPEMRDYLGMCKFHDCTHTHEPGCMIQKKVEEGEIHYARFESYLSMLAGAETHR
ncbi:MAG: ribosome small subunit-dependent GTPase A [Cyclobacteriaceae bacterium]|nr:ribosome small subunit-dependent GTPase A [Cyclobacteriaceae bacterium]MCH8516577.1 ribosome small subunit-dependent GTPase A [Cyclobacteriaceae bacterium]